MSEFKLGDFVKLSEEFKRTTPHSKKVLQRREKGKVVGFGCKHKNTVWIKWIEGRPTPPKTVEAWFVEWLEKCEKEAQE